MFSRSLRFASLAVLAVVLGACTIIFEPYEPDVEASVTATAGPVRLVTAQPIAAGETQYFEVAVPVAHDLLYGEADGSGLRVSWVSRQGIRLAVARTPQYYVGSLFDLATSGSEVDASAGAAPGAAAADRARSEVTPLIDVVPVGATCFGPCVAVRPMGSLYYLEVRNESPSAKAFDLYAYTVRAGDPEDRGGKSNDGPATATPIAWGDELFGAIEHVGDVDWYHYTGSTARVLWFQVDDARLDLVLTFENAEYDGDVDGFSTNVYPGERFRVSSKSLRAGPSSTSGYLLEVR